MFSVKVAFVTPAAEEEDSGRSGSLLLAKFHRWSANAVEILAGHRTTLPVPPPPHNRSTNIDSSCVRYQIRVQ